MEAYEAVLALLALPNLRLDPERDPPRYVGHVSRTFRPVHVLFDAGGDPGSGCAAASDATPRQAL